MCICICILGGILNANVTQAGIETSCELCLRYEIDVTVDLFKHHLADLHEFSRFRYFSFIRPNSWILTRCLHEFPNNFIRCGIDNCRWKWAVPWVQRTISPFKWAQAVSNVESCPFLTFTTILSFLLLDPKCNYQNCRWILCEIWPQFFLHSRFIPVPSVFELVYMHAQPKILILSRVIVDR